MVTVPEAVWQELHQKLKDSEQLVAKLQVGGHQKLKGSRLLVAELQVAGAGAGGEPGSSWTTRRAANSCIPFSCHRPQSCVSIQRRAGDTSVFGVVPGHN